MNHHDKLQRKDFLDVIGTCTKCYEHTPVLNPCCNEPVSFEGDWISLYEFEDEESRGEDAIKKCRPLPVR